MSTEELSDIQRWPPTHYVTADAVVFAVEHSQLYVLCVRRGADEKAFPNALALPGGHLDRGESLADCAVRELAEETGIRVRAAAVYPGRTYSTPGRDPRGDYVTQAHLVLLGGLVPPTAGDDAADAFWSPVAELTAAGAFVAFDHQHIIVDARRQLDELLASTCAAVRLLPSDTVTIAELYDLYAALWGAEGIGDYRNFGRKIRPLLTECLERRRAGGRPAQLYRVDPATMIWPPFATPDLRQ